MQQDMRKFDAIIYHQVLSGAVQKKKLDKILNGAQYFFLNRLGYRDI